MIAYKPFFQVTLNALPSMFHGRYTIVQLADDHSGKVKPAVPSDAVVTTHKVDKQLYEAYHPGIPGTPEKNQVLGKIAAECCALSQVHQPSIPPQVVEQKLNSDIPDSALAPAAPALPRFRVSSDVPTVSPRLWFSPSKEIDPSSYSRVFKFSRDATG